MIKIILETSHTHVIIGLSRNENLIDHITYPHNNNLSGLLSISIRIFLKKHDLSPHQLAAICIGIGPGSYTGTRVSVAIAKGLAIGINIPIIPFCSVLAYIPENVTGHILFTMPTKQSAPFVISIDASEFTYQQITYIPPETAAENQLNFSSGKILAHNIDNLIKSHPSFSDHSILPSSISLKKLCVYLHLLYLSRSTTPKSNLETIEVLYLNYVYIPSISLESLRT
ncbi:MAG: tRNA (adenosine(37)-N6)-threonylcarbamoyltransferase complex dimerization subunit type 1 TsaB [Chlamydiae bacterium]|nr:tRNA (adenosine(37)-N6)-threonylcarbamoyltransferase complex dimerization subunit type 1 TsaB [Chlamydiota bacterium]